MLGLTVNLLVSFFLLVQLFIFPFIFISPDELSHVCVFFFHLSFSRWGVLPWDERAWSWVLVDVWPSCDSSSCPSPPCHPRWAWLCPSQVSSLSQSHLQNNYISYTSSLLSSPLYRLIIIIFIPLFKILSFSFVFFLHKFIFYHHRFSHIFLLGIFVRHLPNFPGTVFSFFHVTSFHFFPHIFVGQHGFHISPCSYFLFPCYFLSLFFIYLLVNMDFIFSLAHLRFSSHQEKYPTSNSSSSRQVNNIWYQISLNSCL